MRKDVVLCLNLQVNYFSSKGSSYLGEKAKLVRDCITRDLRNLDHGIYDIIYTRDVRSPEDTFYSHAKTQCTVGTLDVNMVEGLSRAKSLVISASRPSAVWRTPLLSEIKKSDPANVYLVGAESDSAVLFTAADLKNQGYNVKVVEPLIVCKDLYLHNFSITIMTDNLGIDVVSGIGE